MTGDGLIDISLGLDPDAEHPPAQPGGKMYIVRIACPHPQSPAPHEAKWSEEWSTYKQQWGEYRHTQPQPGMILIPPGGMPMQLKGRWESAEGEEIRRMSWFLCLRDEPCRRDALSNPPAAPPEGR